ncbi:WD40-repeat-containing domain protein [Trametes meyenii]|nr:WD40-repeat-containing domain protein [Trametes meyenii]
MAAILTTTNLTILEHSSLKHPPPVANSTFSLPAPPGSVSWSAESGTIFLASANGSLHQYDVALATLQDLSLTGRPSTEPCVSLLSKDRGSTIIYGQGQQVVVVSTATGKPANTFDTHKAPVTSLSLSNDASLLASTSAHAIHVHNLTLASHTVLRGIPSGGGSINTCAFHPHSRTRLLVGLGSQLLVYDTTRPSGPTKTMEIDKEKKNFGSIVAISCSPFSKTLVAVACSGGTVALIDLEKEKGLFRTVSMPAPVTCLSFSAEGAAVYAGAENGRFLLLDLRALDKPPKSITVSENGDRVVALSVQRKLKPGEAVVKPAASTASSVGTSKPLVQRDVNKVAAPTRAVGAKEPVKKALDKDSGSSATPRRPATRTVSTNNLANMQAGRTASSSRPAGGASGPRSPVIGHPATEAPKRAFSPPRSPATLADKKDAEANSGDLSGRFCTLLCMWWVLIIWGSRDRTATCPSEGEGAHRPFDRRRSPVSRGAATRSFRALPHLLSLPGERKHEDANPLQDRIRLACTDERVYLHRRSTSARGVVRQSHPARKQNLNKVRPRPRDDLHIARARTAAARLGLDALTLAHPEP